MWGFGSVLKFYEFPKHNDQDCLKIFFLISTFSLFIQASLKNLHLNQICNMLLKKNHLGTLTQLSSFILLLIVGEVEEYCILEKIMLVSLVLNFRNRVLSK